MTHTSNDLDCTVPGSPLDSDDCGNCHTCLVGVMAPGLPGLPVTATRMIVCPECRNKRCPKATDHHLACTNSNETGQPGSIYEFVAPYPRSHPLPAPAVVPTPSGPVELEWRRNQTHLRVSLPADTEFWVDSKSTGEFFHGHVAELSGVLSEAMRQISVPADPTRADALARLAALRAYVDDLHQGTRDDDEYSDSGCTCGLYEWPCPEKFRFLEILDSEQSPTSIRSDVVRDVQGKIEDLRTAWAGGDPSEWGTNGDTVIAALDEALAEVLSLIRTNYPVESPTTVSKIGCTTEHAHYGPTERSCRP